MCACDGGEESPAARLLACLLSGFSQKESFLEDGEGGELKWKVDILKEAFFHERKKILHYFFLPLPPSTVRTFAPGFSYIYYYYYYLFLPQRKGFFLSWKNAQ